MKDNPNHVLLVPGRIPSQVFQTLDKADGTVIDIKPFSGAGVIKVILHHDQLHGLFEDSKMGSYRWIKAGFSNSNKGLDKNTSPAAHLVTADVSSPEYRPFRIPSRLPPGLLVPVPRLNPPIIKPGGAGETPLTDRLQQRLRALHKTYPKDPTLLSKRGIWNLRGLLCWIVRGQIIAETVSNAHRDKICYRLIKSRWSSNTFVRRLRKEIQLDHPTMSRLYVAEDTSSKRKAKNSGKGGEVFARERTKTGKKTSAVRAKGRIEEDSETPIDGPSRPHAAL